MLLEAVKKRYPSNITNEMGGNNLKLWQDLYRDKYFYGGTDIYHLSLPSAIATEIARASIIELDTYVEDASDGVSDDYKRITEDIGKIVEFACAFGGLILKPFHYLDGVAVDVVTPDAFVPLRVNPLNELERVVFIDTFIQTDEKGKKYYFTKLEEHDFTPSCYFVRNSAFVSESSFSLGLPCPLSSVESWENLDEEIKIEGLTRPLFVYLKYPQHNNLDWHSPVGMSCFARAVALIQEADEQFSRIIWEYTGSELAIDADLTALKKGAMPVHGERLFRNLGTGVSDGFYQVFSPSIRDSALFNGLNQLLRRIEFICGLSYGILSDASEQAKTATEMKMSRQRFYTTVTDLQHEIKKAFTEIANMICRLRQEEIGNVVFSFDDSLVVDKESEQKTMLSEVAAGLIRPELYLMKRYGVSEEEAKTMLPEIIVADTDHGIE